MRNLKILFLFMGIFLLTVSCGGDGGGDNGRVENSTISGIVLDVSGVPINGAEVTISNALATVTTDVDGKFSAIAETGNHSIIIKMGVTTIYDSTFICNENTCTLGNVVAEYCTFSGWGKYIGNPVFTISDSGEWDDSMFAGAVFKDTDEPDNKYKRMYMGGTVVAGEAMSIGYATSSDGINWVKYDNNPVMTHGNTWDINGIESITAIKDGSMYKMWYEGESSEVVNTIGFATSPDGTNWTPHSSNPVFTPASPVSWDDDNVKEPWVIKEGTTYKMWYSAVDYPSGNSYIGLATSVDGVIWERPQSTYVMNADSTLWWQNGEGLGTPKVINTQSGYTMVYAADDQLGIGRIGMATSTDGITWTKNDNPILDVGTGNEWDSDYIGPDSLIEDSSILKMWYLGVDNSGNLAIGLALTCQ